MLFFRLILIYLSILMIAGGLLYILKDRSALYSFLVAFVSSATVVLASFKNYKDMVVKRLENNLTAIDDRDTIDKIDDPYNLYDESTIDENKNLKDIIKEQKKELKKNKIPLKELTKNSARAFNYIRLIAYAVVVFGFFILLKSGNLNLFYYLITLAIPNIIAVFYLINFHKVES